MVLLHRHDFGMAAYHRREFPGDANEVLAQGLVLRVAIVFEQWLDASLLEADAFLDPGADSSLLSQRWIEEQAEAAQSEDRSPAIDENGAVFEGVHVVISGHRLRLGAPDPLWVRAQNKEVETTPLMPGLEDLLLGRDFIAHNNLLVVIDGQQRQFSLLAPLDLENQKKRAQVLETFED
jgi:hypothetical protein